MLPTLRYIVLIAARDRFFLVLSVLCAIALGFSVFIGNGALVEQRALAVVVAAGSLRLVLATGFLVFIAVLVQRMHESREFEALLTRPLSRRGLITSFWLGFTGVGLLLWLPVCVAIGLLAPAGFSAAVLWSLSLLAEMLLVIALGLFCSLTVGHAVPASLSGMGFYVLSRMSGLFEQIADKPVKPTDTLIDQLLDIFMKIVAHLMPRLDIFAATDLLVSPLPTALERFYGCILQTAVYLPLLLAAALFDLQRKYVR